MDRVAALSRQGAGEKRKCRDTECSGRPSDAWHTNTKRPRRRQRAALRQAPPIEDDTATSTEDSDHSRFEPPDASAANTEDTTACDTGVPLETSEALASGAGTAVCRPPGDSVAQPKEPASPSSGADSRRYIYGTRLIIDGWFQACRGCNEPTAHTRVMRHREVPLCPRCRHKFDGMSNGCYPQGCAVVDGCVEPLCYWLPRVLPPMLPLGAAQRREMCEALVLRQDDAWAALIRASS